METVKVYRWEDCDGIGPYNSDHANPILDFALNSRHTNPKRHPSIYVDMKGRAAWSRDMRSACPSRRKLGGWFRGFVSLLKASGFHVYEVEVNKAYVYGSKSGKQVFYHTKGIVSKRRM